jgi:hypothetical protein
MKVIACKHLDRLKIGLQWIKVGLDLGRRKHNPALTVFAFGDPLFSFTSLIRQRNVFDGTGDSLGFELVFDFCEFLVEDAELLVDGEAAFHEGWDVIPAWRRKGG